MSKLDYKASKGRRIVLAAAGLLCLLAVQLTLVARTYSLNWDEAHHLYDGYEIWTAHDYRANAEVPPLIKLAAALPLLPLHPHAQRTPGSDQTLHAFQDGRSFYVQNGGDRVLLPARFVCLALTVLLAGLVFLAGRFLFGPEAGVAALALLVFDPNLLAHGALVETDVASALFLFTATWLFFRYLQRPSVGRLLGCGVVLGLAFAAKFTGILLVPMLILLCVAEALRLRSMRVLGRHVAALCAMVLLAFIVLWATYGFRYAPAPNGLSLSPQLQPYLASLPNPRDGRLLQFFANYHLLPEAYLWGLANTKVIEQQYVAYFFGHIYRHGPWLYFPAAFVIKSTLPLLLLLIAAPFVWRREHLNHRREVLFLLIPVAVYLAVVVPSHFDIGVRHLLPLAPFLTLLAGVTLAALWHRGGIPRAAAALLVLWQVGTSLGVAPAYTAYGNEAWGGPNQVRHYLSDSNVDWGQQLKSVKAYLDANGIHDCWFVYFPDGAVEPRDYGIPCRRLPTPSGLWWFNLPTQVPPTIDGTVLISESDLEGVESGDGRLNPYAGFQTLKPLAIIQHGVYVYRGHFNVPLASAWTEDRRAAQLAQDGDQGGALQAAQRAVDLAPGSARTQLALADFLKARQDNAAARTHYLAAQQALAENRPDLEGAELGPAIQAGLAATQTR